jgi:hypothetical protein
MRDLRSDARMGWLPEDDMWLTYVRVNERADRLTHDLAVDASGYGRPDPVAAGLSHPLISAEPEPVPWIGLTGAIALSVAGLLALAVRARRRTRPGSAT